MNRDKLRLFKLIKQECNTNEYIEYLYAQQQIAFPCSSFKQRALVCLNFVFEMDLSYLSRHCCLVHLRNTSGMDERFTSILSSIVDCLSRIFLHSVSRRLCSLRVCCFVLLTQLQIVSKMH